MDTRLSRFDDYPIHQTPEPVAVPSTSDRNFYDRYWFNGYDRDGEFYFGVGLGFYPHRGIVDCGFSIVRDGEQHAFHASRRASGEPSDLEVGPFRLEVVEPMRRIRLVIDDNDTGIGCDLEFSARTACIEEGRQTWRPHGRVLMDATRFAQLGRWRGRIRYDGHSVDVDPTHVMGTKDRSWGLRPVGEPEAGGAPALSAPSFFFLWSPIHWDDHCTHFGVFEDADGVPWHFDGAIVPAYARPEEVPGTTDPGTRAMLHGRHRIDYQPGTRRARAAEIAMTERVGEERVIRLDPLLCFRMKGIGYTHPEWAHGLWKGELVVGCESWKTADLDEMAYENLHVQQVMRARSGDAEGVGVLEQLCIGPHAPSGFEDYFDPAR
jgi:hypothetical protein